MTPNRSNPRVFDEFHKKNIFEWDVWTAEERKSIYYYMVILSHSLSSVMTRGSTWCVRLYQRKKKALGLTTIQVPVTIIGHEVRILNDPSNDLESSVRCFTCSIIHHEQLNSFIFVIPLYGVNAVDWSVHWCLILCRCFPLPQTIYTPPPSSQPEQKYLNSFFEIYFAIM